MNTKICSVCKQCLSVTAFPVQPRNANNYRLSGNSVQEQENRCRTCKAEYARNWRKQHTNYRGSGKLKNIPQEDRLLMSAISSRLTQANQRIKKYSQIASDIDKEYLYQLFKSQNGLCALSGVKLRIEKQAIACLSLDKIHPDKGYLKGNVQWVAWAVNRAKGDMDEEVFINMCQQILEYQKVQRLSNGSAN